MAMSLTYQELRRLRLAIEKHIEYLDSQVSRKHSFLEGKAKLPPGKKPNRQALLESIADTEERRDQYITLLSKIQEEMRKLEGVESSRAGFRTMK